MTAWEILIKSIFKGVFVIPQGLEMSFNVLGNYNGPLLQDIQVETERLSDGDTYIISGIGCVYYSGNWYTTDRAETCGYHTTKIEKQEYGTALKIKEELEEFLDAHNQKSKVMELVELSDIIGAVEGYLEGNHPGIKIEDLKVFSDITKRAFLSGGRQ